MAEDRTDPGDHISSSEDNWYVDASLFGLTRRLWSRREVFVRELRALDDELFTPCPFRWLYEHGWLMVPLLMAPDCPHPVDLARNRAACPESWSLLASEPSVHRAAVSRLLPGCYITPHRDDPVPGTLRVNFPLRLPKQAGIRLGDRRRRWRPDTFHVFDTNVEHEALCLGPGPRDALLIDFYPTEGEWDAVADLEPLQDARRRWLEAKAVER